MVLVERFKDVMSNKFNMSLIGELNFFLGLKVSQKEDGIQIHQQKYLREILKKYNMDGAKTLATPISQVVKQDGDINGAKTDETAYRVMVGSLMYLTASRPNIVFVVSLAARFQSDPRESHVANLKRVFRYLKGTDNLCLWYPKHSNFTLMCYTDADYTSYLILSSAMC